MRQHGDCPVRRAFAMRPEVEGHAPSHLDAHQLFTAQLNTLQVTWQVVGLLKTGPTRGV